MRRLLSLETKCYRKKGSTNPANIGRLLKPRHVKLRQQGMSSSRPCVRRTDVSVLLSRHRRFRPKPIDLPEARSPDKSGIFTDPYGAAEVIELIEGEMGPALDYFTCVCSSCLSFLRALATRAFTVPCGIPRACAVSRILKPSTPRS